MLPAHLPAAIQLHLEEAHGPTLDVVSISGMSGADVWRVRCRDASVVVKCSPRQTEARFYREIAPRLLDAGVQTPHLELAVESGVDQWIVLEDIPDAASTPTGEPDRVKLRMLAALHHAARGQAYDLPTGTEAYRWTSDRTTAALSWFDEPQRGQLAASFARLQERSKALEKPWSWISGDPSAANWGRRRNGELVLFDWELFRPGVPATDLAITAPGPAPPELFESTAAAYREERGALGFEPLPWDTGQLVADMVVAKAWTVVMLLAGQAEGRARVPEDYVDNLVRELPGWLAKLAPALTAELKEPEPS